MSKERTAFVQRLPTRLIAGEPQAYLDFSDEFHVLFYRFFLSRGLPEFEAQDLTENCMTDVPVKVAAGMYEPREGASFSAWVRTLMRIYAIDWWRKHYDIHVEPLKDELMDLRSDETVPDVERVVAVQDALWQLRPTHRQIIELYDLSETRTYREVASLLLISEETARVRRHRALKELKKRLEHDPRVRLRTSPAQGGK